MNKVPTEPGWYWYHGEDLFQRGWRVVEVQRNERTGKIYVWVAGSDAPCLLELLNGVWGERVPEPPPLEKGSV